ncbi:MAG: hypothetical protein QOF44_3534 [Streptomyces sp.]|nr:hypothetical protein [Streptomyces sp.]
MNGHAENGDPSSRGGTPLPRVPQPREAAEDAGALPELPAEPTTPAGPPPPPPPAPSPDPAELTAYNHNTLRSLLGAWALAACSRDEAAAVEVHLGDCASCAEEALRLRDAVGLLHQEESLDLDPLLRARVLENCLGRRPARIPVPEWAAPYDAETARLDALLGDLGIPEWEVPIKLTWSRGERILTLCGVLAHLGSVDGIVATSLGLDDPLGSGAPRTMLDRTNAAVDRCRQHPKDFVRNKWRNQTRSIVRTLSFAGSSTGGLPVGFTEFEVPLRDALIDRAFECWIHAEDIANALDYPEYGPPAPRHLNRMIDLAARMLPTAIAERRRAGLAASATRLVTAGSPGRALHLHVEGPGGGRWNISLDSPGAVASEENIVAEIAVDQLDFCQLTAGHLAPERIAAGQQGDRAAIRDVLFAAANLSRL